VLGSTGNDFFIEAQLVREIENGSFPGHKAVGAAFDDEPIFVIGGHQTTQAGRPFQKGHVRPSLGETVRRDQSGDSSPDNHHIGPHCHRL
jgi:hypothetical protein